MSVQYTLSGNLSCLVGLCVALLPHIFMEIKNSGRNFYILFFAVSRDGCCQPNEISFSLNLIPELLFLHYFIIFSFLLPRYMMIVSVDVTLHCHLLGICLSAAWVYICFGVKTF